MQPASCDKIRTQADAFGKGITVLWCVRPGKPTEVQSIRFDADKFTPAEAKKWLKAHDFKTGNFEEAAPSKAESQAQLEICAALAKGMRMSGASEPLELLATVEQDGRRLRRFHMTAYTGTSMRVEGFGRPVVVDLAGMRVLSKSLPILRSHDPERIVAHSDDIEVTPQRVRVSGLISGVGAAAQEVLQLAENGFPWQCSLGSDVQQMEAVDKGIQTKANGRNFDGPLLVARKTTLREISFLPLGADPGTSASIAGT